MSKSKPSSRFNQFVTRVKHQDHSLLTLYSRISFGFPVSIETVTKNSKVMDRLMPKDYESGTNKTYLHHSQFVLTAGRNSEYDSGRTNIAHYSFLLCVDVS